MYVETARSSKAAASALGQDEVPRSHARRDGLRERGRVRHELTVLELVQARLSVALEADEAVRVVLEDRELVLASDLDEPRATLGREGTPARVLEGRDRVEEGRRFAAALQLVLERIGIQAFVVHRESHDLGAFAREDLQRPVVARRLDEHAAGPPRELLGRVEHEPLKTSDGEHDPPGETLVPRRDPLAERCVAAARAVREDPCAVSLRDRVSAVGELLARDELGRGRAAGEGDRPVRHAFEPTRRTCRRPRTVARSSRAAARPRSGRELVPAARWDEDRVAWADLPSVAVDLELSAALDDQVDLLAACVVVAPGRGDRFERRLREALQIRVEVLTNRRSVPRDERGCVAVTVPQLHPRRL